MLSQLVNGDAGYNVAVAGDGYQPRFFRNDNDKSVGKFGHPDCGSVPEAQIGAQPHIGGHGKDAPRSLNSGVPYDYSPVVERIPGIEYGDQQVPTDLSVKLGAGLDIAAQSGGALEHEESADPPFTQVLNRADDFGDSFVLGRRLNETSDQWILPEQQQEPPYFRLEQNDHSEHENFADRSEERPEDRHIGRRDYNLDDIQGENSNEDLDRDRSAHPHIQLIEHVGDQRDLHEIDHSYRYDPVEECQESVRLIGSHARTAKDSGWSYNVVNRRRVQYLVFNHMYPLRPSGLRPSP